MSDHSSTPETRAVPNPDSRTLAAWVSESCDRMLELVADLSDAQLMGPRLSIVNPLVWEIGHAAWFQEKWILRHACGQSAVRSDSDELYDSIAIPHDTRWDLPLPTRQETLNYIHAVRERVLEKLSSPNPSPGLLYFAQYCAYHSDMHNEAFTCTRQTLEYPAPKLSVAAAAQSANGTISGDVLVFVNDLSLGSSNDGSFVFDNEKWEHGIHIRPFEIARAPITQAEFASFVEDSGYTRRGLWDEEGWQWRERTKVHHPVYWQRDPSGGWLRRQFDEWLPLESHRPIVHVNWHEANAYCRWAKRRLPTEAEWEAAASLELPSSESLATRRKKTYSWGDDLPSDCVANLDWLGRGCADVAAYPSGDSAFGCRQMIGNVWEWTSSTFLPYPGFIPDPYREYSAPWFGTHKVLRGGCWATRSRMIRNAFRNFYTPDRSDVWAGFRTCKIA